MAERQFKLEIVTPERVVLSEDIVSLTAPSSGGSLGILANHAPLMTELLIGEIDVRDPAGKIISYATSGGFMEVSGNVVRVLADTAEKSEDIDVNRAREALKRAKNRIRDHKDDIDLTRTECSVKRALNRLHVAHAD